MPPLPNLLCFCARRSKKRKARPEPEWVIYQRQAEYQRQAGLEQIEIDKDFAKGPEPLLPRPRTLTLGSQAPPGASAVQTHAQTASAFFAKLPPDIRLKIYTILLGNRTIHVEIEHCMREQREPKYAPQWRHYSLTQSLKYGAWKCPTTWSQWHCVCHRRDMAMSPLDDCVADGLWHTARDHINAEINIRGGGGDHTNCKLEIAMLFVCRLA
jgi:2EXR family